MLKSIDPEYLPDWTVFTFAGLIVATVTAGVFLMTPSERPAEPACPPPMAQAYLTPPGLSEPPRDVIDRPPSDWMWMTPDDEDEPAATPDKDDAPRRHRHRRRG